MYFDPGSQHIGGSYRPVAIANLGKMLIPGSGYVVDIIVICPGEVGGHLRQGTKYKDKDDDDPHKRLNII